MKFKLPARTVSSLAHEMRIGIATIWVALALATAASAADSPTPPTPGRPPTLRVAVLPFQNAVGDPSLDDWRQAFPAMVRSCLKGAEFTQVLGRKSLKPALAHTDWATAGAGNMALARQIARELKADVVVWGSFRHDTNGWAVDVRTLHPDSGAEPVTRAFTSRRCVDLAESVARGLAQTLDRHLLDQECQNWRMYMTDSEPSAGLLARALALEMQEAPTPEQEKAWRQVLTMDPHCGAANAALLKVIDQAGRQGELEPLVREFAAQQPQLCGAHLALAGMSFAHQDVPGAGREIQTALQLHPGCSSAVEAAFVILCAAERWTDLTRILEQARKDRPDDTKTIIFLACARVRAGDNQAASELLRLVDELPDDNTTADLALLQAAFSVGEAGVAGRELQRLGPQAAESEEISNTLASATFSFRGTNAIRSDELVRRPRAFTAEELSHELDRRLSPEERKLAVNPLEITPEITDEARRLTVGLPKDPLRAFALFANVADRGHGPGNGGQRTASEALKEPDDSQTRLSCQEHAKLFVTLARALGLEAWMVHVDHCADGSIGNHDCAALFLEGHGMLIDPTWRAFGILHESFMVLDDVQAISHQAMQPSAKPDPRRLRLGLKLNPEDRWTRVQFVRGMVRAGEFEAAAEQLRRVQAAGVDGWELHEVAAQLEMARARWQPALAELQRALALNPDNAGVHAQLASVYQTLDEPAEAKEHLEAALRLDRGEITKEFREASQFNFAMLEQLSLVKSGGQGSREGLQRQAAQGDLAAQMALAKMCFEDQPPRTEEGLRWQLAAAEQGNDQAQFQYARNLFVLRGASAAEEIVKWLNLSAAQGNEDAQYRLGLILYEGKLIPADHVNGAKWVLLAEAGGSREARWLIKEMKVFLSAGEMAEARRRADEFKPVKGPGATNEK